MYQQIWSTKVPDWVRLLGALIGPFVYMTGYLIIVSKLSRLSGSNPIWAFFSAIAMGATCLAFLRISFGARCVAILGYLFFMTFLLNIYAMALVDSIFPN